ncbi:hypothetical protein WDU94_012385 [Cyamophila willieti]
MQQVYRLELRNRRQRSDETLQQLRADIERLAHLSYSYGSSEFLNEIATDTFINAVGDRETQQAMRLSGKKTTSEALAYALAYQSAQQVSRNVVRVREVSNSELRQENETAVFRSKVRNVIRCWYCHQEGHIQSSCSKRDADMQENRPNVLRCWSCNERGHREWECRNRRVARLPPTMSRSNGDSQQVRQIATQTMERDDKPGELRESFVMCKDQGNEQLPPSWGRRW